ncbi:hypothetical protein [Marinobacter halophilus]|nr:hypothetical protein [Marinobacter halophilus]GGC73300.1 hypothetical protein GCM10011362_22270 [Marinobacter halophilus]
MKQNLQEFVRQVVEPLTGRDQAKRQREEHEEEIRKAKEAADKSDPAQA